MDVMEPNALSEVCGPDILGHTASFLQPNEIACTLRLVSRSLADQFRENTVVRLSQRSPAAAFAAHWSAPGACRALSYQRRLQLVCLTAASGDVGNLEVALEATGLYPTVEVMEAAAAAGQLHVCRWLAERGCPLEGPYPPAGPLTSAAKGSHASVCEWLLEQGCAWHPECVTSAARGGHPELMRALLSKAPPGREDDVSSEALLTAVAVGCDLKTLQVLWQERGGDIGPGSLRDAVASAALVSAARSPTPDWAAKVSWLLEQGAERRAEACATAASCPDGVARLTLLVERMGFPVDGIAFGASAMGGRVDAVRWMVARGLRPVLTEWLVVAARWGHTEVLRALHAAGCQLHPPERLVASACASGSVETVSWALEACGAGALQTAGPGAFKAALWSGSLELVTWLHERGLGPGPYPWHDASEGGCVAVLELLAEWGADVQGASSLFHLAYLTAARRGNLLTLEALRRLGVPLGSTQEERRLLVARAIREVTAPLPSLRWLRRAVGKVDWAAAAEAACSVQALAGRHAEVQAWVQAEAEVEAQAQAQDEAEA